MILGKYNSFLNVLPCDLVFPIFVAANIFLRRWRQGGADSSVVRPRLELCVQWLNALGRSWKGAEGHQQTLVECESDFRFLGYNYRLLTMAALNTNQPTQAEGNNAASSEASGLNEGDTTFNNFSNFTTLAMENDFDLEYMQWIMALE